MLDPKLTTFLTLVEEKTTVRCAEALHLSQPAVTQHIRALEAEYGVKLFAKEGRRLTLTEAGARFYRLARRLPAMEAQLRAALTEGQAAPLLVREAGSGSREILESALAARGLSAEDFAACHVFESVPVLLELAAADRGVTFAYEVAAAPLLESGRLVRLAEGDFSITRPFTFVTLPDSPFARQEQYLFEHIRDLCARL